MNTFFDENGEYMGEYFLHLDEVETLINAIIEEGKRKRIHYPLDYPDGNGNIYRFEKGEQYAWLYWRHSTKRFHIYRGYYVDTGTIHTKKTELGEMPIGKEITYTKYGNVEKVIDYEADFSTPLEEIITLCREKIGVDLEYRIATNPSKFEFKRVVYKKHPASPKAYILSFFPKGRDDNKKRVIVIKDGTKEIVIDRLVDEWIETPVGKDIIKMEVGDIPDKEIIKALTNKSKISYDGQIFIEEQEYQKYVANKNKKAFWDKLFGD